MADGNDLEVVLSLYLLVTIVGILGVVLILVVIFSLLSMAKKADACLEQMGLGEGGGWLENRQTGAGEVPEPEPIRTAGFVQGS